MLRRGFLRRSAVRCFNWDGGEKGTGFRMSLRQGQVPATVILQAGRSSAQLRWCCRRAVLSCSSDDAASIPKSGLEIKNRCTLEGINRQNLASIRKSEPEIKNRCTLEGINRQNLASIPKFDPEIKNRCSRGVVAVCRRNHSPSRRRKLESDADLVAATAAAGETILCCDNEN